MRAGEAHLKVFEELWNVKRMQFLSGFFAVSLSGLRGG